MSGSTSNAIPILLATSNPAKQTTMRWLLEGLPLAPVTPQEMGITSVPEEEGDTHEAITRLKAQEWSQAASMLAIATDGGLVIPALGDRWESLFTHRFAGPAADDDERLRRLLELMQPYQDSQRAASWVEALAIADRGKVLVSWEIEGGSGLIAENLGDAPRIPGFWVFSVWCFPQFGRTYNQLTDAEKESLDDHWARLRRLAQDYFTNKYLTQKPANPIQ